MKIYHKILMGTIAVIVGCFVNLVIVNCLGLVYGQMSHLSNNDLVWTENTTKYSNILFISDTGTTATLKVKGISTDNTRNPFFY